MEYVNLGATGPRVPHVCLDLRADEMRRLEERYVPHSILGHQ